MTSAVQWSAGLIGSLAAHAALAAALSVSTQPQDNVTQQSAPETQLSIASYRVPQDRASAADPGALAADETSANAPVARQGSIPQSIATASAVASETVISQAATSPALAAVTDTAAAVATLAVNQTLTIAVPPGGEPARPGTAATTALSAAAIQAVATRSETPPTAAIPAQAAVVTAVAVSAAAPASALIAAAPPSGTPLNVVQATSAQVLTTTPAPPANPGIAPSAPASASIPPPQAETRDTAKTASLALDTAPPAAQAAASVAPPATFATAALAWSGGDAAALDSVSLAAIEAFMQPGDPSAAAQDARDGITALLAAVPCARLQTEFIPETGALELRGHVPSEGMRAPVLAALQGEVGTALPVTDNILILPRPQCGALSGIADVGLPQSSDQLTNPRILGSDAHAREFRFAAGDAFVLEMTAPEYEAYVYVDYFDAAGNVLHLMPNEYIGLTDHSPDENFPVAEALNITIGPPYGQEIAVAFAASSPLYEGLRPLQEPAEPYLDWLKDRVAQARAEDPGFKGEWVYFFVSTRAE